MSDLNPGVREYSLRFDRKRLGGESAVVEGDPHNTIVIFHDRVTLVDFGQRVTIEKKDRNMIRAYLVEKAMPQIPMEGQLPSSDPAYKFSLKGHMVVRITDPARYITDVKDPLKILHQRVGHIMRRIASHATVDEYRDLGERLEKGILKEDFGTLFLAVNEVNIDVSLGDQELAHLEELKRIRQKQAIDALSGGNTTAVFDQLAGLLDLLKSLQVHIGDLNLQDDLVQAIEDKIRQLLNTGLPGGNKAPGYVITNPPPDAPPLLSGGEPGKAQPLGGKEDDFDSNPAKPPDQFDFDDEERPF